MARHCMRSRQGGPSCSAHLGLWRWEMRPPPLLLLLLMLMLSPAVAGTGCVVRPGEDLQGAIERAAAAGHEALEMDPQV